MMDLRKTLSVIATSALLFNSLGPSLIVLAQEVTPEPTPIDTSSPAPDATIAPTDSPTDQPTASPDATIAPTDEPTPVPTNEVTTPAPNQPQPDVQGITTENAQPQAPPTESTTVTSTTEPTFTSVQPEKEGNITTTVVENVDLSTITLLNSNVDPAPNVTTDKIDYSPTDVVVITGTGFTAGKTYTLVISSTDEPPVIFSDQVTADPQTSFTYAYQLDGNYRPNYKVEIRDAGSLVASTVFTDSKNLTVTLAGTGGGSVSVVDTTDSLKNHTCTTTPCVVSVGNNDLGTLTATANGGSTFAGWSGQSSGVTGCVSNTCNFSMGNGIQSVTATFNLSATPTPTASPTPTPTPTPSGGAVNLDQCANGGVGNPPVVCTDSAWQNGNLNGNQAHYREGDSVPYRFLLSGLSLGAHSITIEWDTTQSAKHATDYLTSYDRTEGTADPCSGVAGCGSPTTFAIPDDPNSSVTQVAGNFTLFNGTITSLSSYTLSGTYAGNSSTRITINFTAGNSTPVLAVGGHIASQIDWGVGNSAVNINGSPYHMRLIDLDGGGGNQDRSLSAGAVPPVPAISTQVSSANIFIGQSVTDTATYTEVGNNGAVSGTTQFYVCGPGAVTPCTSTSNPVGSPITNVSDHATSTSFTPQSLGTYCFAAYYNPDVNAQYSPTNSTATTNECVTVAALPTGNLTIHKQDQSGNPMNGVSFAISGTSSGSGSTDVSGNLTFSNVLIGGYTVTETIPTNYHWTSTSGDCSNANPASVTVTAQGQSCTFVNTRDTGSVKVNKLVDTDGNGSYETLNPGTFTWKLDGSGTNAMGSTVSGINTGAHDISENPVSNYHFVGWYLGHPTDNQYSCTNLPGYSSTALPITLGITTNVTVQVNLCNQRDTGTVVIHKDVVNPDGGAVSDTSHTFGVSLDNANEQTLTDGGMVTYNNVPVGSHTVTESTTPTDYSLFSITPDSDGGTSGAQITVVAGQTTDVYVTNKQKKVIITVVKQVVLSDGQTPVLDGHTFTAQLNGANDQSFAEGGPNASYSINPGGPYTIGEAAEANYTNLGCKLDGGAPATEMTLGSNQSVNVTCTNKQNPGSISGTKYDENDNVLSGWAIQLWNCAADFSVCPNLLSSTTTNGSGFYNFTNLITGFYQVVEVMQAGWTNVTDLFHNATIDPGTQSTGNDFTNKGALSITACKFEDSNGTAEGGDFTGVNGWTFRLRQGEVQLASQGTGQESNCTTFTDLKPGEYSVTENPILADGWSIADGSGGTKPVTLTDANQEVDFYNYRKGTILVNKNVDTNGDGEVDIFGATDWQWNLDDGDNIDTGTEADNVELGTHTISEVHQNGYHVTGLVCNDQTYDPSENIELPLTSGGTIDCTFTNARNTANLTVHKIIDADGNPETTGDQTDGGNWQFTVAGNGGDTNNPDPASTDSEGLVTFSSLKTGEYNVTETLKDGYELLSASCDSGSADGNTVYGVSVTENTSCTFVNFITPVPNISITKSNDKTGGTSSGSNVTYTLNVANGGNINISNVVVSDVLPAGFTYVTGSTTGATTTDPSISGATLSWDIGTVLAGTTETISYQAKIAGDEANGTYTNFATCTGNTGLSLEVIDRLELGQTIDCNTASSSVTLGSGQSYGGNLQGQVLGISTELPATGSPTALIVLAISALTLGFILKKKNAKN